MPNTKYFARVIEEIETGKGTCLQIGIFQEEKGKDPTQIGSYVRHHSSFYDTFFPFKHENGKWYALYSADYTATRVMELPSCKDIGGEEGSENGFCPTEFYVPNYIDGSYESDVDGITGEYQEDQIPEDELWEKGWGEHVWDDLKYRDFGFVSGCVWGDDWSWKIRYIDLSRVDEGIIEITPKFGHIWLPHGVKLSDAIDIDDFENLGWIRISCPISFDSEKNYPDFNLNDFGRRGKNKAIIIDRRNKLKDVLGEDLYEKWGDLKTLLFVLNIRDYEGIIEEIEWKMLNEKKEGYLETIKGMLFLNLQLPCLKCRHFYDDSCNISKKVIIKKEGNCNEFEKWSFDDIQKSFGIEKILCAHKGISSVYEFGKKLQDDIAKLCKRKGGIND